ncbi:MAG: alpha/beta hydrolase [Cytophagaceae bacterium]|nr:MAG: alpha/beta hydrolase [Cytophagaceae bacterium]
MSDSIELLSVFGQLQSQSDRLAVIERCKTIREEFRKGISSTNVLHRNNVNVAGSGKAMVFAHGFGCDQNMWRYVAPSFSSQFTTVLFDHVGSGDSDAQAYDPDKYSSLDAYALDVAEIGRELKLQNAVFVGHSVSSMIGALVAQKAPGMFDRLVMVGPSPRYINDGTYYGGFSREQIEGMLQSMEDDYLGWSAQMAPVIMGNTDRPELAEELARSFCKTDPRMAKQFAKVTFTSDCRGALSRTDVSTLILQCSDDVIAPAEVGEFVHQEIAGSKLIYLRATGHCPHLSAPAEVISEVRQFVC